MSSDLAVQLLADWSYYRTLTKHFHTLQGKGARIGPKKMTPELRALLDDLIVWCREKRLEPRLWLFALFKNRSWVGAPSLLRGHLLSEKQIFRYRRMRGIGFFGRRVRATGRDAAAEQAFDPNRDLAHTVEAMKRQYVQTGKAQECLEQVLERTLGFHPASKVCWACPLRDRCSIRIQSYVMFDILALREGRLSSSQAESISRRVHG
jgi:hypothetical protein